MPPLRSTLTLTALGFAATLAACSGGGGTSGGGGGYSPPAVTTPTATSVTTPTPTPLPTATVSSQQVVTMALPASAIGSTTSSAGPIGGYTQQTFSQTLAFAPGSQIMIRNGQAAVPHTFNVVSTTGFPASPTLSTTASGSSTIDANFASGTVQPNTTVGPFTLSAGTYYIGCAFHYASNTMRTILTVAAGATPGPQATPPPGTSTPPPGNGGGY